MGTVHTFTPRQRRVAGVDARAAIEEAAQAALDTADRLIALLNDIDDDTDRETIGDVKPSLSAPEGPASQIAWLRRTDNDSGRDS